MPDFDDLGKLMDHLQKQIDDTLQNEVYEAVIDVHVGVLDDTIYNAWIPSAYERRAGWGGLKSEENINRQLVRSGQLKVTNDTPFNDEYGGNNQGNLIDLIEGGDGSKGYYYNYPYGKNTRYFVGARPVMEETQERIERDSDVENALRKGLIKRGIDLE